MKTECGTISVMDMKSMIKKSEETGSFEVKSSSGRDESIASTSVKDVSIALEEGTNSGVSDVDTYSTQ